MSTPDAPRDEPHPNPDRPHALLPIWRSDETRTPRPRLARRATRLLRIMIIGVLASIASAACLLLASSQLLHIGPKTKLWALAGNMSSVVLALISIMQLFLWWNARQEWLGRREVALGHRMLPSRLGAWLGWALLVVVPVSAWHIARHVPIGSAWRLAMAGGLLAIVGVLCATRFSYDPAARARRRARRQKQHGAEGYDVERAAGVENTAADHRSQDVNR